MVRRKFLELAQFAGASLALGAVHRIDTIFDMGAGHKWLPSLTAPRDQSATRRTVGYLAGEQDAGRTRQNVRVRRWRQGERWEASLAS
jgi:hypothetical protein